MSTEKSTVTTNELAATEPRFVNAELPVSFRTDPPANLELRKIADDVLDSLKYSYAVTAANPQMKARGRADTLFQQIHQARKADKKAADQKIAQGFLQSPDTVRASVFGRYGKIEAARYAEVGSDAVSQLVGQLQVDPQKVTAALKKEAADHVNFAGVMAAARKVRSDKADEKARDEAAGAKYKKLGFYLAKVHCNEETSGPGSDEIVMGGTAVGPSGKTWKIKKFTVSDDFDTGETVDYSWLHHSNPAIPESDKLFAEFNLGDAGDFPKVFGVIMAMAEEDWGGFAGFLDDLWNLVKDKVQAALTAAGTALFGPLGTVLANIAYYILGGLIDWIINIFEDDIFKPRTVKFTLASARLSYYKERGLAEAPSKLFPINFVGDGGSYTVWAYFRVHA